MGTNHALILCDGEPPSKGLFLSHYQICDILIATDGAGYIALDYGVTPHLVIGDMDSFVPTKLFEGRIIKDFSQESNDLEKALDYAFESDMDRVVVLGATGKRLDHTLKNLSVFKKYNARFKNLTFEDDYVIITLLPPKYTGKGLKAGTSVSLFPLSGKVTGITTKGLKYPLFDEDLENGIRDGSSNETTGTQYEVNHRKGDLLMFVPQPHEGSKFKDKAK